MFTTVLGLALFHNLWSFIWTSLASFAIGYLTGNVFPISKLTSVVNKKIDK